MRSFLSVFLAAALASASADAQLLNLPDRTDATERLAALNGELQRAFYSVLEEYDQEILARPFDVVRRIDRCRFVDEFTYSNEYLEWLDAVYELSDQCRSEVEAEFPTHAEVILYGFEYLYGEELLAAASPYDQPALRPGWTPGQLSRLYSQLATAADSVGNELAGRYALRALELDAAADVRLIAAQGLIDSGDMARAAEILRSPFDLTRPDADPWYFADKIRLLALAGDGTGVAELYRELQDSAAYYDSHIVAVALRDTGHVDLARAEFALAVANPGYMTNANLERFRFELQFGSESQAREAYEALRDIGWSADPLAINRAALFFAHPSLSWQARDLLGMLGALMSVLVIAGLALIPVSVVHYRGLVLRLRKGLPAATGGLQLRHAWYGMFALWFASLVGLYFAGPLDFLSEQETLWGIDVDPGFLARSLVAESFIQLLFLFPLVWFAVRREPDPAVVSWSIPKAVLIALLAAIVLRLPLLPYWLAEPDIPSALTEGMLLWELLERIAADYGILTAFWLIVVAAPVAEEFLFRRVLLTVFSRHISFWAANVLQAFLFAAMHMDASALVYLFLMGLIAGFLARRSGGLLAPILFHAFFNLIAGLIFLL